MNGHAYRVVKFSNRDNNNIYDSWRGNYNNQGIPKIININCHKRFKIVTSRIKKYNVQK